MEHPYGKQYGQEGNPRAYMTMRDYRNLPYQCGNQQPVGRNPNPPRSMREYRDQWMSAPVYSVPSTYPPPLQYDHPEPPCYASTPQSPQSPQPPQSIPPFEQAILDLTRKVNDFVEENKELNAQLRKKIHTEENSMDQRLDGLKDDFEHKWDNLQDSIEDLNDQQQCPPEEENLEEECLTEKILVEQVQQHTQEELKMELVEAPEELQDTPESGDTSWPLKKKEQTSALISEEESQEEECQSGTMVEEPCLQQPQEILVENFEPLVGAAICLWEEKEATFPLTEKSSGHETGEEPQEPILQPIPMKLNPSATVQATQCPLLVPPSADLVYIQPPPTANSKPATPKAKSNPLPAAPPDSVFILPMPAAQPKPQASTTKATPSLLVLQNIRRLVASVHAFATTSKTMAAAYIAWHSGWFGCGFGFGAPGPRHF